MGLARTAVVTTILSFSAVLLLPGCAHIKAGKGEDPRVLYREVCGAGQTIRSVSGSIWMNLSSKEAKGSFPATVQGNAPDTVTIEVTNLLGAREALIQIAHGKYSVDVPARKQQQARKAQGQGAWGGIPLRWASELFLGHVPCPPAGEHPELRVTDDGDLVVDDHGERFIYGFRKWAGHAWADTLHWQPSSATGGAPVDFKFDDPEDKTGAPKKWEAKSSRGEVKVRWRDLKIQT